VSFFTSLRQSAVPAIALALLLAGTATAATNAVPAQKKALLAFAKATNSQLWNVLPANKWVELSDPCNAPWEGVTCDANGNIE
jgi:hypothetical protein